MIPQFLEARHRPHARMSPWAEALRDDLDEGFVECVGESVRGKARLVGNLVLQSGFHFRLPPAPERSRLGPVRGYVK